MDSMNHAQRLALLFLESSIVVPLPIVWHDPRPGTKRWGTIPKRKSLQTTQNNQYSPLNCGVGPIEPLIRDRSPIATIMFKRA